MTTVTVSSEDIDGDLRVLGAVLKDCLRDSSEWTAVWAQIDTLLEKRLAMHPGTDILNIGEE